MTGLKLNVGCGHKILDGWVNIDINDGPGVDVVADVCGDLRMPYRSATEVLIDNVLEHVPDPYMALRNLWQVLEVGGLLVVRVPHWRSPKAKIVTHRHLFDEHSLDPVIRGRHLVDASPENRSWFSLEKLSVSHRHPMAWHQRRYLGRELIGWGPHEIEWRLRRLPAPVVAAKPGRLDV